MSGEQKPGDPADKAADGAFGGVQSHRAGYGDDKLARVIGWLRDHPTATLASGEGALLLGEIDRLREDLSTQADWEDWADWAEGEMEWMRDAAEDSARAERILAALREPSEAALDAATAAMEKANSYVMGIKTPPPTLRQQQDKVFVAGVRAAVAAAEQEVGRE